jgi:uncharacterized protein (TIGR02569 family)
MAEVGRRVDDADRVRLARPVAALDGRLVVGGWSATTWQRGAHRPGDVTAVLAASTSLHDVLAGAGIEWPAFLRGRTDRWAVADRVAWGEERPPRFAGRALREVMVQLGPILDRPWCGPSAQLVHGDLAGNVLFDEEGALPPAVVDLSPYHRPAAFADAVVVADAVAWHGAPLSAADDFSTGSPFGCELLARAVVYRLVAAPEEAEAYRRVADAASAS